MECSGRAQVFVRVRPSSAREDGFSSCVEVDDAKGLVRVRNDAEVTERVLMGQASETAAQAEAKEFAFDAVFPGASTQRDVFAQVGLPVLRECLKGFNGTILAYGQTGSGKTHSLLHQGARGEDAGLLPRLVASLFVHVAQDAAHVYQIEAAAVQVYNEHVDDLLHPEHNAGGGSGLNVQAGGLMTGLTWISCRRPDMLLDAFTRARAGVVYAETKMNKASSRSHAVFQIKITKRQRATAAEGGSRRMECTHSLLSVVDLAGSERVKRSGVEGVHFKEAAAINKSLLAFGNVVSALAAKRPHVPFRDSKLTKILEVSIGGNCKTALLVCASPSQESCFETLNSLEFASRAMRVEVNAKVNSTVVDVSAGDLLSDLNNNLEDLGVSLGTELEAMRRASAEAEKRAAQEAKQRQEAVLAAEAKADQLKKKVAEEEQRSQSELAALTDKLKCREKALDEARVVEERLKLSAKEDTNKLREHHTKEIEKLRLAQATMAKEAAAEQDALKQALTAEKDALARKKDAEVQAAKKAHAAEMTKAASKHSADLRAAVEEAECRIAKVKEAIGQEELEQALEKSRRENQCLLANISNEHVAERAKLQTEIADLRTELQRAVADADQLRTSVAKLTERLDISKLELESHTEELKDRAVALDEARAALSQLVAASTEAEARLRCEHARELEAVHEAHRSELLQLSAQCELKTNDLEARAESAHADLRAATEAHARQLEDNAALWATEREQLEKTHRNELDALRERVASELRVGRADFEERLAAREREFEEEMDGLRAQLGAEQEARLETESRLRAETADAVSQAWEAGTAQQRKLAAAFKAARCMASTREAHLREEHDALMQTVAVHEATEDELRRVAETRARDLQSQRARLRSRDREVESLSKELKHRVDTDRIFGGNGLRSCGGSGLIPPLPGKKVGDPSHFAERRRRHLDLTRSASCERPPLPAAAAEAPASRRGHSAGRSRLETDHSGGRGGAWDAQPALRAC